MASLPPVGLNIDRRGQAGSIVRPLRTPDVGGVGRSGIYDLLRQQQEIRNQLARKQLALMQEDLRQAKRANRRDFSTRRPGLPLARAPMRPMRSQDEAELIARGLHRTLQGGYGGARTAGDLRDLGRAYQFLGPREVGAGMRTAGAGFAQMAGDAARAATGQRLGELEFEAVTGRPPTAPSPYSAGGPTGYRTYAQSNPFIAPRGTPRRYDDGSLPGTVPETDTYKLHKGEVVLEADQVDEPLLHAHVGDKLRKMMTGQIKPKKGEKKSFQRGTLDDPNMFFRERLNPNEYFLGPRGEVRPPVNPRTRPVAPDEALVPLGETRGVRVGSGPSGRAFELGPPGSTTAMTPYGPSGVSPRGPSGLSARPDEWAMIKRESSELMTRESDDLVRLAKAKGASDDAIKAARNMRGKAGLAALAVAGVAALAYLGSEDTSADIIKPEKRLARGETPETETPSTRAERVADILYGEEPLTTEAGTAERAGEVTRRMLGIPGRLAEDFPSIFPYGQEFVQGFEAGAGPPPEREPLQLPEVEPREVVPDVAAAAVGPQNVERLVADIARERVAGGDLGSPEGPLVLRGDPSALPQEPFSSAAITKPGESPEQWTKRMERESEKLAAMQNRQKADRISSFLLSNQGDLDGQTFKSLQDEIKRLDQTADMYEERMARRQENAQDRMVEIEKAFTRYQQEVAKAQAKQDESSQAAMQSARREFEDKKFELEKEIFKGIEEGYDEDTLTLMIRKLAQMEYELSPKDLPYEEFEQWMLEQYQNVL